MADANTPVVIPPDKPEREDMKVYHVWKAIETLAKTDNDPARLRSLMDDFQWFLIDENLEPALNFLTALKAHWRHHHDHDTATRNRHVLRKGGQQRRGV